MKKRKKLLFLWVLMGMLMLSACGKENEEEDNRNEQNESVEDEKDTEQDESADDEDTTGKKDKFTVVNETEQSGEKSADENEAQEPETEQTDIPAVTVTSVHKEWYAEDKKNILVSAESFLVNVENEGFDALEKTLAERFQGLGEGACDNILRDAKEHYASVVENGEEYFPTYSSEESITLTRCDGNVLSFCNSYYDYTGGAHGMYGCGGITFDVQSGKELAISDILTDEEGFYTEAIDYLDKTLWDEYGEDLFPEYKEVVAGTFSEEKSTNWYMTGAGIVIIYNPYDLGPYAMGMAEVLLPYKEFGEYIDTKYTNVQGQVVASVPVDKGSLSILGEDSEISLKTVWNEYDMQNVSIVLNDQEVSVGEFGRFCDAYVIKREDGRSFLFVTCDYMSADYVTLVYEVTEGNIRKCHEVPGAMVTGAVITPDKIEMSLRLDVLGTYSAKINYLFDENGSLTQEGEIYNIDSASLLTIKNPLPVTLEGESVLLNTDTQIIITGTNNINEAYFEVPETGATGVIYYEMGDEESWIHMIDGVSEYEYFEMLPYAG